MGIINVDFTFKLLSFGVTCYTALTNENTTSRASQRLVSLLGTLSPHLFLMLTLIQDTDEGRVV